jgi:hypothetical protein
MGLLKTLTIRPSDEVTDALLLFARFVSDRKLSPQEIRRMRKLLEGKSR